MIFKVQFDDVTIISVSFLQIINKNQFNDLLEVLILFMNKKSEDYQNRSIVKYIFTYHIEDKKTKIKARLVKPDVVLKINKFTFSGYSLPLTTNVLFWGKILFHSESFIIIADNKTNEMYYIHKKDDKQDVKIMLNKKVILEFTDYFGVNEINFTRILKDRKVVIVDGKVLLKTLIRNVKFIKPNKFDKLFNDKFLTFDLETRVIDSRMTPYCCCFYDGDEKKNILFKWFYRCKRYVD